MSVVLITARGQAAVYASRLLIPGAALCFIVLTIIAIVWVHPTSKSHLDRVSFRILVYAVFVNMVYGTSVVVEIYHQDKKYCALEMWWILFTSQLPVYLLFFIGLNLQLVLSFARSGRQSSLVFQWAILLEPALQRMLVRKQELYRTPVVADWDAPCLECCCSHWGDGDIFVGGYVHDKKQGFRQAFDPQKCQKKFKQLLPGSSHELHQTFTI
ncbi:hypothetical protein Moror_14842 [Moniliophthora roreri MCA 2997]|uniref:Uncharacterized protein n=1 Tax=Moniliophthora roreri (strain MCA 2997) TaxID=1381753 RepID=V2X772_MONRO|nr:hypothetical protein Moror_14842 [Moniliophthora roreri MCA 2997]